jgi:hypothetical protein
LQLTDAKLRCKETGDLRLLEIRCHKIFSICSPETKIENLSGSMSYRVEKVPADQVRVSNMENLLPVGHYEVDIAQPNL